jgi:hypothetical protein
MGDILHDAELHIEEIKAVALSGDDERAHVLEYALYVWTLQLIADKATTEPEKLAAMVLKTGDIDFGRYCA